MLPGAQMRLNQIAVRLAMVGLAVTATAQVASAQGTITVLGGFVSSKAEVSGDAGGIAFGSRSGVAVGVGYDWALGSSLRFAPEFLFVNKGFEISEEGIAFGIKLGYVEIPLLVRADLGAEGAGMRPFLFAGPAIAIKLNCKAEASIAGFGSASTDCETGDPESDFIAKSTDVGAMAGAGLQFGRWGVSVRYSLGLSDILDDGGPEALSFKNRALMVLGSIGF